MEGPSREWRVLVANISVIGLGFSQIWRRCGFWNFRITEVSYQKIILAPSPSQAADPTGLELMMHEKAANLIKSSDMPT